jgi:Ras-related protein Rab-8A
MKRLQQTIPVGKDCVISNHRENDAATRRTKILMLGDSGVGKSSLILRWTMDTFSPSLTSTVGVNFKSKKVTVANELTQVQVWDTAGQENFHKITTSYYKGAQGILLVYDVTDRKTLENVEYWIKNIKSHASDTVQIALIGNKTDVRVSEHHNITHCATERGQAVATKFGIPFFETSAKDSMNVDHAFLTLVQLIVESNCSTVIACNNTKGHSTTASLSPLSSCANGGGLGGVDPYSKSKSSVSEVGRSDGKSNLNGAKEKKTAFPISHHHSSKNSSKLNGSTSNSGQASSDKDKCMIQ